VSRTIPLKHERIFISIASYRDPQLIPTIEDCLARAAAPNRLSFGICWQHDTGDSDIPWSTDSRFRILDVPWNESRGACWARSEIMKLWRGEQWFLQLDSHCRLIPGWDDKLIQMAQQSESPKPVLSTYACSFTPGVAFSYDTPPMQIAFNEFSPEGIPLFKPYPIHNLSKHSRPIRARFLSAGFLFSTGSFVEDIPYDPELYFLGEEISLSIRAFTNGYDLFHPHAPIAWHDYRRTHSIKHWNDHVRANGAEREWRALDAVSKERVNRILQSNLFGLYGIGETRTLEEYEAHIGLDFKRRMAQNYTRRCLMPPNPRQQANWVEHTKSWQAQIRVDTASVRPHALPDVSFWYIAVHDEDGNEIDRLDMPPAEMQGLMASGPEILITRKFESDEIPQTWTICPRSQSAGWLKRLTGTVSWL
jgi:hypothetical protein